MIRVHKETQVHKAPKVLLLKAQVLKAKMVMWVLKVHKVPKGTCLARLATMVQLVLKVPKVVRATQVMLALKV